MIAVGRRVDGWMDATHGICQPEQGEKWESIAFSPHFPYSRARVAVCLTNKCVCTEIRAAAAVSPVPAADPSSVNNNLLTVHVYSVHASKVEPENAISGLVSLHSFTASQIYWRRSGSNTPFDMMRENISRSGASSRACKFRHFCDTIWTKFCVVWVGEQ